MPVERISIGGAEILPPGVDLSSDSATFVVETPEASIQLSLAELCGTPCVLATGFEVPKPAFTDTLTTTIALPGDLISASLAGGTFNAALGHSFNFDPLRPSSDPTDPRGHILIRLTSNGNVVAFDSIDGDDQRFPSMVTLAPSLPVEPVEVTDSVDIEVVMFSPEGDSTTIDASDTLGITFAPSTVEIDEVTVAASGLSIDSVTTALNFGDVDTATVERVRSGALRLGVQNPFAVTGTLDMTFRGSFPTIQHSLAIEEGDYEDRLEFTADETHEILHSANVEAVASGTVNADGGTLTVTPADVLVLDSEFELVVLIGPREDR